MAQQMASRRSFVAGSAMLAAAAAFAASKIARAAENDASSTGNPSFESAASQAGDATIVDNSAYATTELPEKWDREADVVVIGSGAGGSTAAWFAADGGLSTIVLEECSTLGGSAIANSGCFTYGATQVQKNLGYDTTAEQYKSFLQYAGTDGVPDELLDLYCTQGTDVADWLMSIGVKFDGEAAEWTPGFGVDMETFEPDPNTFPNTAIMCGGMEYHPLYIDGWQGSPEPTSLCATKLGTEEEASYNNFSTANGHGGPAFMLPIIHSCEDKGVEYLTDTKAVQAYKDPETGRCVGVKATDADGNEVTFHAVKAVVIAGGCWLSDADLVRQYCGHWANYNMLPLTIAEGSTALRLGIAMGGNVVNGDSMWAYAQSALGLNSMCQMASRCPMAKCIVVDENGNRFLCEDEYTPMTTDVMAYHTINRPNHSGKAWFIVSDEVYQNTIKLEDSAGQSSMLSLDDVVTANSIQELADAIGTPVLPDTIATYNKYAEQGEDPMFGKAPADIEPIEDGVVHAAEFKTDYVMGYSHGGLDININGQVLDQAGNVIEGLYAAGRSARTICEGRHEPTTNMPSAMAMLMGRIIGKYISENE